MTHRLTTHILAALVLLTTGFALGVYADSHQLSPATQFKALKHALFSHPQVERATLTDYPYWQDRTSLFAGLHGSVKNVMLGDSLTDGAEWQELLPKASIANRGINGDTSYGTLRRLDSVVAMHPEKAFVMLGNSDILAHRTLADIEADYLGVLEALSAQGIQPVIQSTLYVGSGIVDAVDINAATDQLNDWLKALASKRNWLFVDLNRLLENDHAMNAQWTHDGIHLNGQGYQVWRTAIADHLGR